MPAFLRKTQFDDELFEFKLKLFISNVGEILQMTFTQLFFKKASSIS